MEEKIKIAINIINKINDIDKKYMPKIGGSLALCYNGLCKKANDIDIIVNTVDGIVLPYEKREVTHKKRLNKTISYFVDGFKVDIIESLMPRKYIGYFEDIENVLYSKKIINAFLKIVY